MAPPEGSQFPADFPSVLSEAIRDVSEHGYSSREEIDLWLDRIRRAADARLPRDTDTAARVRRDLGRIYDRLLKSRKLQERVPGVGDYTIAMVSPELRAELDRRILAAVDLIKLHRREAVEKTLQRFFAWSTSIPRGGEGVIDKRAVRRDIGKSVAQFGFERRRVAIDQAAKLSANVSDIVAVGNGAIAAEWRHIHQAGYDGRPEHVARDGRVFAIRDSWAWNQGLIKHSWPTTDSIDRPAEKPFCQCSFRYLSSLRRVPDEMLTRRGQDWLHDASQRASAA